MHRTLASAVLLASGFVLGVGCASAQDHDLLIRGGRVLDGSGNPWMRVDIAITGEIVTAVGKLSGASARRTIDAEGLYIAPGFIDVHSHAGGGLATAELSHGEPLLAQGITTVVINPDGGGAVDLLEQRTALLEHGLGVHVAQLVPHGAVRSRVLGMDDRGPTTAELQEMCDLVELGMEEGAFGLSSGPWYAPGSYSGTEELIELAKVAAEFGGVYTSHIRDESDYNVGLVAAVDEVIRISEEAALPGVVTHIKALGPRVWGFSEAVVMRIQRARDRGVSVFADQYPYAASGTSISGALVPRWALAGGVLALLDRLAEETTRARIRAAMLENLDRRGGAGRIQFQRYLPDPSIEGRTLAAVAEERGIDPVDLCLILLDDGGAGVISFNMLESDIATFMRQSWTMTCSDGGLTEMGVGSPHPRYYGSFPRKLRKYALEDRVIDLASAIRSMTSLPARVFGITGRGAIGAGAFADLVIFDLERLTDKATYDDPHQLSEGMRYVIVNGRLAIDEGQLTGVLNGTVLSRSSR